MIRTNGRERKGLEHDACRKPSNGIWSGNPRASHACLPTGGQKENRNGAGPAHRNWPRQGNKSGQDGHVFCGVCARRNMEWQNLEPLCRAPHDMMIHPSIHRHSYLVILRAAFLHVPTPDKVDEDPGRVLGGWSYRKQALVA